MNESNRLIDIFMGVKNVTPYRKSGKYDINGVEILEGSIINANGYNSNLLECHFHCVEYDDGIFGSDIYSDFEPISSYKTIEVIGHCSDYAYLLEVEDGWHGNLGAVVKDVKTPNNYKDSWNLLMPVYIKIVKLSNELFTIDELRKSNNEDSISEGVAIFNALYDRVGDGEGLEEVWTWTIKFIEWYNKHNQ